MMMMIILIILMIVNDDGNVDDDDGDDDSAWLMMMKVDDDDYGDGDNGGEHLCWWLWYSDESYISQRSDVLWRFACGDVFSSIKKKDCRQPTGTWQPLRTGTGPESLTPFQWTIRQMHS